MTIDAHQHFWKYDPVQYDWIDDSMAVLQGDFLPEDLQPLLQQNHLDACIAVQADTSEKDTAFLLELAQEHAFIAGVVGWVDFCAANVEERLDIFSGHKKLCGYRHIVQAEPDVNFLLRPDFLQGIQALGNYDLTYDILVFPHQLGAVLEFVKKFPNQRFVLDHLAKPYIKDGFLDGWKVLMKAVAECPNVSCKVSGMVTEADWQNWSEADFEPYLDVVTEAFGTERLLFGSDWPVCLLAGSYADVTGIVRKYTASWSANEKANVFGGNALKIYNLNKA